LTISLLVLISLICSTIQFIYCFPLLEHYLLCLKLEARSKLKRNRSIEMLSILKTASLP
jgi:hypothetical protein